MTEQCQHFARSAPNNILLFPFVDTQEVGGRVCLVHARHATFVLTILTLTPELPSPREAPQVNQSGPQTLPTKHAAKGDVAEFNINGCHFSYA